MNKKCSMIVAFVCGLFSATSLGASLSCGAAYVRSVLPGEPLGWTYAVTNDCDEPKSFFSSFQIESLLNTGRPAAILFRTVVTNVLSAHTSTNVSAFLEYQNYCSHLREGNAFRYSGGVFETADPTGKHLFLSRVFVRTDISLQVSLSSTSPLQPGESATLSVAWTNFLGFAENANCKIKLLSGLRFEDESAATNSPAGPIAPDAVWSETFSAVATGEDVRVSVRMEFDHLHPIETLFAEGPPAGHTNLTASLEVSSLDGGELSARLFSDSYPTLEGRWPAEPADLP